MTEETARLVLAAFDGIAGLVICYALVTETVLRFPRWHRFFISIGGAGMLSQSVLNIARFNGYDVAEFWWTWAGKDICIGGIALSYAVLAWRGRSIRL